MKKIVFLFFCLVAFKASAQMLTVTANNTGLASSPLAAGATARKVLGFQVSVSGSASITIQSISFTNIGTPHASSASVSTFVGTTETVRFSGGTISANGITFTGGSLTVLPGTSMDLFLVIDVNSSATSATTQTSPTLGLGAITIDTSGGATVSQSGTISSGPFSFISNNTTIVVSDAGRPAPDFINSTLYAAGTSTSGTSTALFGITVTDAGGDSFPTIITSLKFTISNANNLTKAGLWDGTSQVGVDMAVDSDGTVTFTGSPLLTIPSGSGKTITLRAAFVGAVEDNYYLNVALIEGTTQVGGSSTLETINSDSASTTIKTATDVSNKINVVATKQVVAATTITPVSAGSREVFDFTINATDNAGNLDEDYAGSATISKSPTTGTMTMGDTGSATDSFVNGVVSWSNINIDAPGSYTLTSAATSAAGLGSLSDVQFTVNVSGVSITNTSSASVPAAFCSNGTTKSIGDIVISESSNSNFTPGTSVTLHLLLPYGFVFDNSVTTGLTKSPLISDITIPSANCYTYSRGNTVVIISFTVTGTRFQDVLTIRGLKVKYTADNPTTVITGNIIRIGGTAIIAGNTANGKAVHGTLKAADATNAIFGTNKATAPDFTAAAGTGVSAGQTTFDESIQTVSISPSPSASTTNVFYGDGITQSGSGANRTVTFSPQAVGLGDYPITYRVKEGSTGQSCYTQTTKTFTVVQIFSGLRNSYCTNTAIRDLVSLPATKMVGSTSYTLQAIAYSEGTTSSGNIGFTGTGPYRTFYFPITGNIPNTGVTWTLRALYQPSGSGAPFTLSRDVAFYVPPAVSVSGLPASGEICNTTSSISLTGTPSGGTFSGPGITGSIFYPGTVPIANQDITQPVTLSYTYTDTNGCSNTFSSQVKVVPPPVSGFTTSAAASNNIICKPLNSSGQPQPVTVTFTNMSSVPRNTSTPPTDRTEIRGYTWDFGESSSGSNNQSTIANPQHIYTDPGDHTVRLSVTGAGGCTVESTAIIKIGTTPDVRIITLQNNQEFCSDELDGDGKSVTLNISQGKNEYKIGTANTWADIGTTATFKLKNTTATSPDFDFSGQVNTPTAISYRNTETGTGCTNAITITVSAYRAPIVDFNTNANSDNALCRPLGTNESLQSVTAIFTNITTGYDNVTTTAASTTVTAWKWNFGTSANNTSTAHSPNYTYNTSGEYQIALEATGKGGCVRTLTKSLKVGDTPNPKFISIQNNQEFCSDELTGTTGKAITLTISSGTNEYKIGTDSWISIGANSTFYLKNSGTTAASNFNYSSYINSPTDITYKNTDNLSGCNKSITIRIAAYNPPTVNFTTINTNSDNALCRPLSNEILQSVTATFNNTTTGYDNAITTAASATVTAWEWNFGTSAPNNTSTAYSPAYTYNTSQEYQIALKATGKGGCVSTLTKSLKVGNTPNPKFISIQNNQEFCSDELMGAGKEVTLTISSGTNEYKIGTDSWISIGAASSFRLKNSTTAAPDFNYSSYINSPTDIIYKNTDDFSGCNNSKTIKITAYNPPGVNFTTNANSDNALCRSLSNENLQPVTATFTNTTTGYNNVAATSTTVTAWEWNFGTSANNTSTVLSPDYIYNTSGEYQITLKATGKGGCIRTLTKSLKVGNTPNPKFISIQNNQEFCSDELMGAGKEVTLTISSGTNEYKIGTDSWISIGAGSTFYLKNSGTTATSNFNYSSYINSPTDIIYKNTDNFSGCNNSKTIRIAAYNPPGVNFTTNANSDNALCRSLSNENLQPVTATFTNTTTGYNNVAATSTTVTAWEWNFGTSLNNTSTVLSPTYIYNTSGEYQITLTATGRGGCIRPLTKSLKVGDTPNPKFTSIQNNQEFCSDELTGAGKEVTLSISSGTNEYKIGTDSWISIGAASSFRLKNSTTAAPDFNYSGYINISTSIIYKSTDNFSGCNNSATIHITAYNPPTVGFTTNANSNGSLCRLLNTAEEWQPVAGAFTNTTTGWDGSTTANLLWKWNYGVPSSALNESTTQDGSFSYNSSGTYTILLEARGRGGCVRTISKSIIVGDTPNPKITTIANDFCADDLTAGIALGLNLATGTNYFSVNNGAYTSIGTTNSIGLTKAPSAFPNVYDYSARIGLPTLIKYKNIESLGKCENEISKTIVVYKPPTIAFKEDSTLVNAQGNNVLCLPLNANGQNTSIANRFWDKSKVADNNNNGSITSWEWDFGDTGTSTLQNPIHTYTSYNENGRVTLNITGSGNCRRSWTKSLLIGRIPNPKFPFADFYKDKGASYCESDLVSGIPVMLSLTDGKNEYSILGSTYKSIGNNNTFTLYGNTPVAGIGNNYLFNLSYLDQTDSIIYKNTENVTTCSNTTTGKFIVHKLPLVNFGARESRGATNFHCLLPTGDTGTDFYLEVPSNQPGYLAGINENVSWDFGDGAGNIISKTKSINHKYNSAGEYRVKLEIRDQFTCQNSKSIAFPVVYQPVAGCYAAKLCAAEGTEFKFTTSLPAETEKTKATYKFDFGDHMTIRNSLDAGTWKGAAISHPYAEQGKYSVKLTVSDSIVSGGITYACADSKSMITGIVPQVTEKNYLEQFENQGGNWVAQGWVNDNQEGTDWNFNEQNSWPANSNDQGIFWSTRNHQKYESKQRSALYSPCFDLTPKGYYPIMSFDYFTQLPDQKDGVYLEYSYDGKIWTRLTNDDSGFGRNWYNKASVSGLTMHTLPDASYGQEIEQLGWTDQSNGWGNAKYDLSGAAYKKKIRFRFLFGTNDDKKDTGDNGFAMDNFSIYPRNTTVLGEHFLDKSDAADIDRFFAFREQDTLLIKISYLSALRNGNDSEYLLNSSDPAARSAYYGVATSTWSFINGVNKSDGKNVDVTSWGAQVLGDRALDNSPVEISDIKTDIVGNNKLVISPKLRALAQIPKGTWVVQVLVVENVNGRQIMRKMLPNAAGTTLTAIQGRDQVFSQTYRWEAGNNISDVSKAGVIVFVQNLDTKSIMQVSYKKLTNLPSLSFITGFEDISEEATLYPNPAKGDFYLELPFADVTGVTITNSAGQEIDLPYTLSGQLIKANVSTLARGIYVIQVRSGKGIVQKKLAVSR